MDLAPTLDEDSDDEEMGQASGVEEGTTFREIRPDPEDAPPSIVEEPEEQPDTAMDEASNLVDALEFRGAVDEPEVQQSQAGVLLNDELMVQAVDACNEVTRDSLTTKTVNEADGSVTFGADHDRVWGRPMARATQGTVRINADGGAAVRSGSMAHHKAMGFVTVQQEKDTTGPFENAVVVTGASVLTPGATLFRK